MESRNKDLKVDLNAVIASKSERLAKYTPKFLLAWLKKVIHQDELNEKIANLEAVLSTVKEARAKVC